MAQPPTDETTFLSQVLAWVAAAIAAVGAWLWSNTMGRIARHLIAMSSVRTRTGTSGATPKSPCFTRSTTCTATSTARSTSWPT